MTWRIVGTCAIALAVVLGVAACGLSAHERERADRARIQHAIDRGATWIATLRPPPAFTPVACTRPTSDGDRCWRVEASPEAALLALAPALAQGGFGTLEPDCGGSPPDARGEAMACSAWPGVLRMRAIRDVDPSAARMDDGVLGTSTVQLATVHLGD
ncbi:hypothetical protein [Cellulomonas edaphi]|uniref:Uncharacterized protein n=1 Tax=Cellulomonas edaphi TaxID=3053468 RepID=A0ABT7S8Y3_9CELL|nr:hypothetical protein [Cellulomons edaphi]MDM7832085.1 hypothetical protein [Cellulomons edaphi]